MAIPDFSLQRRRLLGAAGLATSWPHSLDTIFAGAETISRRVREMSAGRFLIQPFAAGELVPGLEVLKAVKTARWSAATQPATTTSAKTPPWPLALPCPSL